MEFSIPPGLVITIGGIIAFAVVLMVFGSKPANERGASTAKLYKKAYAILSDFFLTSGNMQKITDQLSALSVYNPDELRQEVVKYWAISTGVSAAMVIAGVVLFKDTISVLVCIIFAIVINSIMVDEQINKTYSKVYNALKSALSSIRQEYLRLESIPDAIGEASIPALLSKPFDEIYQLLTSADGELLLLKFCESNPFRSVQTLASICYNINNSGDEKDQYGNSNFVQALTMLTSDVNTEIQKLTYTKIKFGIVQYLALLPIFTMNIIEGYFGNTMPGCRLIYNGMVGYISRIVILVACALCYSITVSVKSPNSVRLDDRTMWSIKLLQNPTIRQIIYNIEPKNKARKKMERKLTRAQSKKGPEHIMIERVTYVIVILIFATLSLITVVTMAQDYYANTTDQLSLVADESMDKFSKEEILALDEEYMGMLEEKGTINNEEATTLIRAYMPGLSDLQIQDQMARIENKYESMQKAYFHWYYFLIVIVVGLVGWIIPDLQLMFRQKLIATEAEDDFMQLQTLMAILMNMDIDVMDSIWQMAQSSRIHKDMLIYCYHSYASNPELELARLASKTRIPEFKRFIKKLELAVSELSLSDAYSDLIIERDHMLRLREQTMIESINKKRKLCGPISMAPFILLVLLELLVPIGLLGVNEFTKALGSMGG